VHSKKPANLKTFPQNYQYIILKKFTQPQISPLHVSCFVNGLTNPKYNHVSKMKSCIVFTFRYMLTARTEHQLSTFSKLNTQYWYPAELVWHLLLPSCKPLCWGIRVHHTRVPIANIPGLEMYRFLYANYKRYKINVSCVNIFYLRLSFDELIRW
jgi:hypothetical protein